MDVSANEVVSVEEKLTADLPGCLSKQITLQIFHWTSKYLTSPWLAYVPPL